MYRFLENHPRLKSFAGYAFAAGICVLVLIPVLQLWRADLRVPFLYDGDALLMLTWAKGIAENGWYLENPSVAAPFGMEMQDFPMADNLLFLLIKLLVSVTAEAALAVNLYFLATFPLTTVTALFALRRMGISFAVSLAVALLYAFTPYHFLRGEYHLFLASYFLIPVMVLIILRLMQNKVGLFVRDRSTEEMRATFRSKRAILTFLFCFGFSAAGIYYAYFACFFLVVAALVTALARKQLQPLYSASILIGALILGALVNLAPSLLYRWQNGVNQEAVNRQWVESEVYGMKVTQLLLPVPQHRLRRLAELRSLYFTTSGSLINFNENAYAALGAVGGLGFLFLLGRMISRTTSQTRRNEMLNGLGVLNVSGVLLATMGGLGTLVSLLGFRWIRCYNRISIFLAFFALIAVAIVLHRLQRRLQWTARGSYVFNAGLVLLVTLGVLDQTSRAFVPAYANLKHVYQHDAEFIGRVEAYMPPNAMIFQLPYVAFPESIPPNLMGHYDHTRAYLHSTHLRWSHGAMKGRDADLWQREAVARSTDELLLILAYAGFDGVYIDRNGFDDGGASLECCISDILATSPLTSADGRYLFFPLISYGEDLRRRCTPSEWQTRRDQALCPIRSRWNRGFAVPETTRSESCRWCASAGTLTLENCLTYPRRVRLEMDLETSSDRPAHLAIEGALVSGDYTISKERRRIVWTGFIPPGAHDIHFTCDGPRVVAPLDPRTLVFRVHAFSLKELE
jgi:hypothetical protein